MPTLTQLEYIVAVDRWRHFAKAAKACHVTQPTLSMQIAKAEDELGVIIFDRQKQPILATEAGLAVIEQAKTIIREVKKLEDVSRKQHGSVSGSYRLGIIPTLAPYVLPLFVAEFAKHYPAVNLQIEEMKTSLIIEALFDDGIDGAMLATPLHESTLIEEVLFYEPFYLYVHPGHLLAKREKVREEDLHENEIWLLEDGHCLRNQIVRFCDIQHHGSVLNNVSFAAGNLETLRYLTKQVGGCTLLPHLFVQTLPALEKRDLIKSFKGSIPTREVSFVYRREVLKRDITQALITDIKHAVPKDLRDTTRKSMDVLAID